jgi:glutaredoxin 3
MNGKSLRPALGDEDNDGGGCVSDQAELFTTPGCPFCASAREDLEWRGIDFTEYDVEGDHTALARMLALTGGVRTVPVIVEPGRTLQVGWNGRGCAV